MGSSSTKNSVGHVTRSQDPPETCICQQTSSSEKTPVALQVTLYEREKELQKTNKISRQQKDTIYNLHEELRTQAEEYEKTKAYLAREKHELSRIRKEDKWKTDLLGTSLNRYLSPYAEKKGIVCHTWTQPEYLGILELLARDATEADVLQSRISSLQEEMLATVSKAQVSTDEQFAGDFRRIISLVKSFSRKNQVAERIDVISLTNTGGLLQQGVSHACWRGRAGKKMLVEAWIWSLLIQKIFKTPFMCFGSASTQFNSIWEMMYSAEHNHGWPMPTSLCESWRCTTVESMMQLVNWDVMIAGKMQFTERPLDQEIVVMRADTLVIIENSLGIPPSTEVSEQLLNILNKSSMLAVEMSRQKYRLQVTYPSVGCDFNKDTMNLLTGSDGDDVNTGKVACVVNPGLTKWGDTHGNNFDCRYDIVPALVQLETGTEENETGISLV